MSEFSIYPRERKNGRVKGIGLRVSISFDNIKGNMRGDEELPVFQYKPSQASPSGSRPLRSGLLVQTESTRID